MDLPHSQLRGVMRCNEKTTKSHLTNLLKSHVSVQECLPETCLFVIDGVVIYCTMLCGQNIVLTEKLYLHISSYTLRHFSGETTVVFDRYHCIASTMCADQRRSAEKGTSSDLTLECTSQQLRQHFLPITKIRQD